jgi:hypothetical protein
MLSQPSVMYTYYMKDASVFWAECDDSINLHDYEDNTICINGVNADAMFMACRNALCSKRSVFGELKTKDHTIKSAKEMIEALQNYVDKNDTTTEDN